ncbi:unnamed protein product [Durusdinium trenchii]|uniref:N-acetyltransferase domain-containing protein n=1 Tax=Durusdinium trenchii TaxID=1381693 RepID=A0ABP0L1Q6_9DINO
MTKLGARGRAMVMKDDFTLVNSASKKKALEVAREANLEVLNQHGQTLMFAAAGRPSSKGGAEEICQVLEARGLDPSARDVYDQTPLFAAAQEGNLQCASWLISQGCHVNHSDLRGQTPLCIAFRHSQMEMVLKLTNELGASMHPKDLHGRRPPFFGNPIFRKAFIAKRKNQPETPSPKRRRLEREDSTALWKRFRGDLAYRCQGPEVMREWAFLDEDVPDDTVPKNCQVWASNNEYEVVVPPPEATPRIRVLEREFLLDHADYLAGYELCRAMSPDEWADFSGVPVNEPDAHKIIWNLLKPEKFSDVLLVAVDKAFREIHGYIHLRLEEPAMEVCYLKVQREMQRKGLARMLIEGGIQSARARGWNFQEMYLNVALKNNAIGFYEKMGFKPVGPARKPRSVFAEWTTMRKPTPAPVVAVAAAAPAAPAVDVVEVPP